MIPRVLSPVLGSRLRNRLLAAGAVAAITALPTAGQTPAPQQPASKQSTCMADTKCQEAVKNYFDKFNDHAAAGLERNALLIGAFQARLASDETTLVALKSLFDANQALTLPSASALQTFLGAVTNAVAAKDTYRNTSLADSQAGTPASKKAREDAYLAYLKAVENARAAAVAASQLKGSGKSLASSELETRIELADSVAAGARGLLSKLLSNQSFLANLKSDFDAKLKDAESKVTLALDAMETAKAKAIRAGGKDEIDLPAADKPDAPQKSIPAVGKVKIKSAAYGDRFYWKASCDATTVARLSCEYAGQRACKQKNGIGPPVPKPKCDDGTEVDVGWAGDQPPMERSFCGIAVKFDSICGGTNPAPFTDNRVLDVTFTCSGNSKEHRLCAPDGAQLFLDCVAPPPDLKPQERPAYCPRMPTALPPAKAPPKKAEQGKPAKPSGKT